MTGGELPLTERVERHLEVNPEATVAEIAGALGEHLGAVAETLHEATPESRQDTNEDGGDRAPRVRTPPRLDHDRDLLDVVEREGPLLRQELVAETNLLERTIQDALAYEADSTIEASSIPPEIILAVVCTIFNGRRTSRGRA